VHSLNEAGEFDTADDGHRLFLGRLTFDMRGGRKQAKPDCGRPLDGRVRPTPRALDC
jgi:hypothetical protein